MKPTFGEKMTGSDDMGPEEFLEYMTHTPSQVSLGFVNFIEDMAECFDYEVTVRQVAYDSCLISTVRK